MDNKKDKLLYIAVMALYGTTGIFKRFIPFTSSFVSFSRAVIGTVFLFAFIYLTGKHVDWKTVRRNLPGLLIVGLLLGFNWIMYFEACMYTTVAKASLCYYMAPVIILVLSPVLYNEKLSNKKILCIILAVIGMILVSGVLSDRENSDIKGIVFGLIAAVTYASIVILSKKITDINPYDKTAVQLLVASLCLIPFALVGDTGISTSVTPMQWIILALIGILNTGIAYVIYFGSITKIDTQTIAIFAYADPVVSVLLSALVLKEPLGIAGIVGAILIIGAMIISET